MIEITKADPRDAEATALLEQSHALMRSLYPPELNAFLEIDELCAPHITFLVAKSNGRTVGTGALSNQQTYGEIKSIFVAETARGQGASDALMKALEEEAKMLGLSRLTLETGEELAGAMKLYARHGYTRCGPFGDYVENGSSVFMEKSL